MTQAVEASGGWLRACAIFGQPRPLPPLDRILTSHPLLHAAEGQLSREALAAAAEFQDLTVQHVQPEQAGGEFTLPRPPSSRSVPPNCCSGSAA
jgi:hypothetical protein